MTVNGQSPKHLTIDASRRELLTIRRAINRALKCKQGKPYEYSEINKTDSGELALFVAVRYQCDGERNR